MKYLPVASSFILSALALSSASADVVLPKIFSDHMVLQQGVKLPVWGTADPGEKVTVALAGAKQETAADAEGRWKLVLPPIAKSDQPVQMRVSGKNTVEIQDVLIGEVWLCSGQSNMEWRLGGVTGGAEAVKVADFPQIRFFQVTKNTSFVPLSECDGKWVVCTPGSQELAGFSAVGYFFGQQIHATQQTPVGLIGSYWGGTPAQAWTSAEALKASPSLAPYAEQAEKTYANIDNLKAEYDTVTRPKWEQDVKDWEALPAPKGPKPREPRSPDKASSHASVLYNGMIHPIVSYGMKGVIWYQGEANAGKAKEYETLFPALIADWRTRWGAGDFPFIFVQLAGWAPGGDDAWPNLRNAQLRSLSVPHTGMTVAIDVGEEKDIHPKNKATVGQRLALAARKVAYGEDIVYSGPIYREMKVEGNTAILLFNHVGGGLVVGNAEILPGGGNVLNAFEIAGAEGNFVPATAKIVGQTVVVEADGVNAPNAVRYAWRAWPSPTANLYNAEGLPASPFSTEETPRPVVKKP